MDHYADSGLQFHNNEEPIVAPIILWITTLVVLSKSNDEKPIVARKALDHNASCLQSGLSPLMVPITQSAYVIRGGILVPDSLYQRGSLRC